MQMRMYTDAACLTQWAPSSGAVAVVPIIANTSCTFSGWNGSFELLVDSLNIGMRMAEDIFPVHIGLS